MKTTRSLKLYLAIVVIGLALVWGGCATAPKMERFTPPPLGSTFTFSRSNTGSFGSGTEKATWTATERTWEGKRMTALGIPGGVGLFNADGNQVAILGPDDKPILSYDPPIGYDFPLEVGKTSTKSYRVTVHATKQTMPFDWTWKVEAYGDVTAPAGTFKAFKISTSDTFGQEQTGWMIPELGVWGKRSDSRTAKYPSGAGTREIELISYTIAK
jgi:hypothetical protein